MFKQWKKIVLALAIMAGTVGIGLTVVAQDAPASANNVSDCVDTTPNNGDYVWGWNETTGKSCRLVQTFGITDGNGNVPLTDQGNGVYTFDELRPNQNTDKPISYFTCQDPDGDSYGWRQSTRETCRDIGSVKY